MKKNKKIFLPVAASLVAIAGGTLASCGEQEQSNSSGQEQSYNIELHTLHALLGPDQIQSTPQIPLLFKSGEPDIAYAVPNILLSGEILPFTMSEQDGVFTYKSSAYTLTLDSVKDLITIDNYSALVVPTAPKKHHIIPGADFVQADEEKTTCDAPKTITFDFKKYGFDILKVEEGGTALPFAPLTPLSAALNGGNSPLVYNGTDLIGGASNVLFDSQGNLTKAGQCYYGGAYANRTTYSQSFADYNYNSLVFMLDNFFGLKTEKNIADMGAWITSKGYGTKLRSTDPKVVTDALGRLIYEGFDESHNSLVSCNFSVQGKMASLADSSKSIRSYYKGARLTSMDASDEKLANAKAPFGGDNYPHYQKSGDTAMIYFYDFAGSAYNNDPTKVLDDGATTFSILYHGFKKASEDPEIKNVILNLADNVGGQATALVQALGFISEGGLVRIEGKYQVDGTCSDEYYRVDTNLDGVYDAKDGYKGKFDNIYILGTESSFSCGNAFPYFAKAYGNAKLIGTKTGGGNAVVGTCFCPTGDVMGYSGNNILGTRKDGVFTSNDAGATPDYLLADESYYFDVAKMAGYLKTLA